MPDARISAEQVRDPAELNQPGLGRGRDPERSPMLWQNIENAAFTTPGVPTWLPLVWGWPAFTVETETADPGTMLKLYQRLLRFRRDTPALNAGAVFDIFEADGVLRYTRSEGDERVHVFLNFTPDSRSIAGVSGRVSLNSQLDREGERVNGDLYLRGSEAVLLTVFST